MLYFTRVLGQSVVVGAHPHECVVTVEEIKDGQVKLSFAAAPEVPVDRMEIWRKKVMREAALVADAAARNPRR